MKPARSYAVMHATRLAGPAGFWSAQGGRLHWDKKPTQALRQDANGAHRWFRGGELNTSFLCLYHHVQHGRGAPKALIFDSPVTQTLRTYTYAELLNPTACFAVGLRRLGAEMDDRVIICLPNLPEAVVAMLACARLGAVHPAVFGAFAPHELVVRIDDAQPKVTVCASGGMEFDRIIPYKPLVGEAIAKAKRKPAHMVVHQREFVTAATWTTRSCCEQSKTLVE